MVTAAGARPRRRRRLQRRTCERAARRRTSSSTRSEATSGTDTDARRPALLGRPDQGHRLRGSRVSHDDASALKDIGPAGTPPTPTHEQLHHGDALPRDYRRSDGRNTPGVDVPYAFDGASTAHHHRIGRHADVRARARAGQARGAADEPGRATAARRPSRRIADVTFYGTDQAGNDVQVTGSIKRELLRTEPTRSSGRLRAAGERLMALTFRSTLIVAAALLVGRVHDEEDRAARPVGPLRAGARRLAIAASPDTLTQDGQSTSSDRRAGPRTPTGSRCRTCRCGPTSPSTASSPTSAQLSAKNVATGADGIATFVYTAPTAVDSADRNTMVTIKVTPQSGDARGDIARTIQIRLVPAGTVSGGLTQVPDFTVSPSAPKQLESVIFDASDPRSTRRWSATRGTSAMAAAARAGRPRTSTVTPARSRSR